MDGATLILFDPHEDVRWIRDTLDLEAGNFERLVLGGDYFDAWFAPDFGGHLEMCHLLIELRPRFGDRLTILLGNHDIHYLELRSVFQDGAPFKGANYTCSGFSVHKAKAIHDTLPREFWLDARLFTVVGSYLVSHAGIAPRFWQGHDIPSALTRLEAACTKALSNLNKKSPLLCAGRARKGRHKIGGLTWLDWEKEFQDSLPMPQIVGHSPGRLRRHGRSWCVDCHQRVYAIVDAEGLVFKVKGQEVQLAGS